MIATETETQVELIIRLGLGGKDFDPLCQKTRILCGEDGEKVALEAFRQQIIPNHGARNTFPIDEFNKGNSIYADHKNGDLEFINPNTGLIEFVDVKNTTSISHSSLMNFRQDGWFFVNAFVESNGMFYGMVRNNDDFKKWIQDQTESLTSDGKIIHRFLYRDLMILAQSHPGIELYKGFNPSGYRRLIGEIKIGVHEYFKQKIPKIK